MASDQGRPVPPPPDLNSRKFPLRKVSAATWWRIYSATHGPCYFSQNPGNRFSSAELGIFYLADQRRTAFWEIYWDDLATRPEDERRIAASKLNQRNLIEVRCKRDFRVFDATDGKALKAVSAPVPTFSVDYPNCQAWARALAQHPSKPEGILYPSAREVRAKCLALFAGPDCSATFDLGPPVAVANSAELLAIIKDDGMDVLDE